MRRAKGIVNEEVAKGTNVAEILMESMIPAMAEIGDRFSRNEAYVPEMLIAARAMQAGLDILDPLLAEAGHEPIAKVAIGTVKGDLHDIGKNLVGMMFTGGGLRVVDVGTDVPAEKFVEAVKAEGAQVCAMSALLTTTMPQMTGVVKALKDADVGVKTIIGGAPVTQAFADEIGADGYAADAASAADVAKELMGV